MGKMGKFALVEGALVITIALYVALSFRRRFKLIRQLLLLVASIITGSLLALFGQVYQTGADTWQLFFGWAVLVIPWVAIARFPALWLLWLGLIHACLILYIDVSVFFITDYSYQDISRVAMLTAINFMALNLWLLFFERKRTFNINASKADTQSKPGLHWSTYVVGLLSTYFITRLAIIYVINDADIATSLIALLVWVGWCGFMVWRFYQRRINLLMLTYLCVSVITVIMFWAGKWLLYDWEAGGFLLLALLLIAMSSAAVVWLRKVARLDHTRTAVHLPIQSGADYE